MIWNFNRPSRARRYAAVWLLLFLAVAAPLGLLAQPYTSVPIASGSPTYAAVPYSYTGLVVVQSAPNSGALFSGSGAVVDHPRVVYSAAHVVFDENAVDPWLANVRWHRAWSSAAFPSTTAGKLMRGYKYIEGYAASAMAEGISDPATFNLDFVVYYSYEDTANGSFATSWGRDGLGPSGVDRLKASAVAKLITGYPSGLHGGSSGDSVRYLMHQTGPFTTPFSSILSNYVGIYDVSTGPGNSGGPVWVMDTDSSTYKFAGVLVSGLERSLGAPDDFAGVYGLTSTGGTQDIPISEAVAETSAPFIQAQPTSRRVNEGTLTPVVFSVTAVGPDLTYQWYFNDNPLVGATSSTFSRLNVSPGDAGAYKVVITNPVGSVTSQTVILSIDAVAIDVQPNNARVLEGTAAEFSVSATGVTTDLSYQWYFNGNPIAGATAATYTITNTLPANAGNYYAQVRVTSSNGNVVRTSRTVTLEVKTLKINTQPADVRVTQGTNATFSVTAIGDNLDYQWFFNGAFIANAFASSYTITGAQPAQAGSYYVLVGSDEFVVQSRTAVLTVDLVAPVIATQPANQRKKVGEAVTFSVATTSAGVSYQWFFNDTLITGATSASYTLDRAVRSSAGSYRVRLTASGLQTLSEVATLTVDASRLVNVSTRGFVPAGGALVPGFVLRGFGSKSVLVRGVGPALGKLDVAGFLADPSLELYNQDNGDSLGTNDNWGGASDLAAAFAQTGAFDFLPDSKDAAVKRLLPVNQYGYTAWVKPQGGGAGIALAEVYEVGDDVTSQIINVSTLGFTGPDERVLIAGFVVNGTIPKPVLIRAVGPGLPTEVSGRLADPQLEVTQHLGPGVTRPAGGNDNWGGTAELKAAFGKAGAQSLTSDASRDAAVVLTLDPGVYTVQVSGVNNTSGTVLVEVYDLEF